MDADPAGVGVESEGMTGASRFHAALSSLRTALDQLQVRWMLIGGLAVIARGVLRHTTDVDVAVWAPRLDTEAALAHLRGQSIVPRVENVRQLASEAQILLLTHTPSAVDVDLSLAWLPFEDEALTAATAVEFGNGLLLPTARAEDLVIYKVAAWRERDRTDIERLLLRHGREIELARVRRHVRQLAELMERPERADELEVMLKRVLL